MSSHDHFICRESYGNARRSGAPSVGVTDMGGGDLCVQTSDGKITEMMTVDCCRWSLKFDVAERWLAEHKPNPDKVI